MVHAGDMIDNTIGVHLGWPTLAAAALGQVFSDTSGVLFGGTIEALALRLGLPLPHLTPAQQVMRGTKMVSTLGGMCGVVLGCSIGMLNLLVIDLAASERAKRQKELDTIVKTVMLHGQDMIGCERASMFLVDADAGELFSCHLSGMLDGEEIRLPVGQGIAGWVAKSGETANVDDVQGDSRWCAPPVTLSDNSFKPRNMLCVPVKDKSGDVVAVLQFINSFDDSGQPCPKFTSNDEKLSRMLCHHVGIFIEQALGE